jgi:NAD(P)-dependent dehydrogenase (short-subunit alcohol dehydrogenase family)
MSDSTEGDSALAPPHAPGARLRGKRAIVTGAGFDGSFLGVGAAIAIVLGAAGAEVVIVDRDVSRAENTTRGVAAVGGVAHVLIEDVAAPGAAVRIVEQAIRACGGIDILVNNAAIAPVETDDQAWDEVLRVNVTAPRRLTEAVVPHLRASGGGSVVNIVSSAAIRGGGAPAYTASKGALAALTRSDALRYGRDLIRVNAVAPGHIYAPMATANSELSDRDRRRRMGMLGTEGTPWDVAYAAMFLATDEARWITAITLPVDAGMTAGMPLAIMSYDDGELGDGR